MSQVRIKCSAAAFPQVANLVAELLANGGLLAAQPGSVFVERIGGIRFVAYRLECGGIGIREKKAAKAGH